MPTLRLRSQKQQLLANKILNSRKFVCNVAYTTLFFTSVASAGTMGPIASSPLLLQGFYAGIAGGGAFTTANEHHRTHTEIDFPGGHQGTTDVLTDSSTRLKSNLIDNSGIGELFLGWGFSHNRLYLGLEGFINYSSYNMHNSGSFSTLQHFLGPWPNVPNQNYIVTNNWQVNTKVSPFQGGLELRPGFFVTPSMLVYGLAGFSAAKVSHSFKLNGTVIYSANDANEDVQVTDVYPFRLHPHTSQSLAAWRLGAGFEYAINSKWAARMNYAYVNYGNLNVARLINRSVTSSGTFGTGTLTVDNASGVSSIATNTVMVGISRYIG